MWDQWHGGDALKHYGQCTLKRLDIGTGALNAYAHQLVTMGTIPWFKRSLMLDVLHGSAWTERLVGCYVAWCMDQA